ncbi:PREDICTED: glycine-rich RNA-binding, abscisic acid-inducible protein-like [Camelina sativa]|uniref:Glycine-rich RNA-binding, abscisic acid-inducible protein-like n=1 Tax=Camelina sativa TaxID=90675 RepID=A0ABM0T0I3_CAMSA|nr:PREDICTED: glycine-rich RNA-binding, abscisic acid-inducible protein-like [Camelina sativa]
MPHENTTNQDLRTRSKSKPPQERGSVHQAPPETPNAQATVLKKPPEQRPKLLSEYSLSTRWLTTNQSFRSEQNHATTAGANELKDERENKSKEPSHVSSCTIQSNPNPLERGGYRGGRGDGRGRSGGGRGYDGGGGDRGRSYGGTDRGRGHGTE